MSKLKHGIGRLLKPQAHQRDEEGRDKAIKSATENIARIVETNKDPRQPNDTCNDECSYQKQERLNKHSKSRVLPSLSTFLPGSNKHRQERKKEHTHNGK